jgi:hypothetical protein
MRRRPLESHNATSTWVGYISPLGTTTAPHKPRVLDFVKEPVLAALGVKLNGEKELWATDLATKRALKPGKGSWGN